MKEQIASELHREQMMNDINAVNGFTIKELKKWSDAELIDYYKFSIKKSIFMPEKEFKRAQMKNLLNRAVKCPS